MDGGFEQGFALILEAQTEYEFYQALVEHLARRHPECRIEKQVDPENFEPYYLVWGPFGKRIVRMNAVGTITQIHNSIQWFNNRCAALKNCKSWTVFLCYDTDSYNADITKFYQDDWQMFRDRLSSEKVGRIVDLAASADIEDVFLQDLDGIRRFLGMEEELTCEMIPAGRKGSARLKQLLIQLRSQGKTTRYYHKGARARELIQCLDLDRVIKSGILPLEKLEEIFLGSNSTLEGQKV